VQRKKGKIGRQAVKFRPPPKAKKKPSQGVKKEEKKQFEAREKNLSTYEWHNTYFYVD
jgi:hypothetical protein